MNLIVLHGPVAEVLLLSEQEYRVQFSPDANTPKPLIAGKIYLPCDTVPINRLLQPNR